MNVRDRMSALRPQPMTARVELDESAPHSLAERVERMATRARGRTASECEIAEALDGTLVEPGLIRIERDIPLSTCIGNVALGAMLDAPLGVLAPDEDLRPERLTFLDTETTGLAGGTGTIAFLLAMARIEGHRLHLTQWLLTAFKGEAAMLQEARDWLGADPMLVSFNGKSFDVPLLATRCRMHGEADVFSALPHLDLLAPTRRAFARHWEDCRLQTAEKRLLRFHRDDDLPGAAMPQAWAEFLRSGLAAPMSAVLDHNRRDVVSLAALMATLADVFANPDASACDAAAIARGHVASGRWSHALELLAAQEALLDENGLLLLASLLRRQGRRHEAVRLWRQLAERDVPEAIEALAKHHEHARRDYAQALQFTHRLVALSPDDAVTKRALRLTGKLARNGRRLL